LREVGDEQIVSKPFQDDELISKVRIALDGHRLAAHRGLP